jgi:parallel beta-helix repeat protein
MTKSKRPTGQALGILTGLAALLLSVGPARAESTPVTECGQVLSAPGKYHLTADLGPCTGDGVVINASGVHLTLAGFTITGTSSTAGCSFGNVQAGVLVQTPGGPSGPGLSFVDVNGGTVTGFFAGILLGASFSRVSAMTVADSCLWGIAALGTHNLIDTNVVTRNRDVGVHLFSSNNVTVRSNDISGNGGCGLFINGSNGSTIRDNIVRNNRREGICSYGNANVIEGNDASGNFEGILVSGMGTVVRDNTAHRNGNGGIVIGAGSSGNRVMGNTAWSNGQADLSDGNAGCDTNSWRRNVFETDSVADVSDGGAGTGCIK